MTELWTMGEPEWPHYQQRRSECVVDKGLWRQAGTAMVTQQARKNKQVTRPNSGKHDAETNTESATIWRLLEDDRGIITAAWGADSCQLRRWVGERSVMIVPVRNWEGEEAARHSAQTKKRKEKTEHTLGDKGKNKNCKRAESASLENQ